MTTKRGHIRTKSCDSPSRNYVNGGQICPGCCPYDSATAGFPTSTLVSGPDLGFSISGHTSTSLLIAMLSAVAEALGPRGGPPGSTTGT
jgi:hypothetical protein